MEKEKKSVIELFFATIIFSYLTVLSINKSICWAVALITIGLGYLCKIELDVWYKKYLETKGNK